MLAGCEFACKNDNCEYNNTGFNIVGTWPLGRIELVIENPQVKLMEDFRNTLKKQRKEGKKYVCITYPNTTEVPVEGYRVQTWCPTCHCVWNYDIMNEKEGETSEEVLAREPVPTKCPKCEEDTQDFKFVVDNGINCPNCNEILTQNRWFTSETVEEKLDTEDTEEKLDTEDTEDK